MSAARRLRGVVVHVLLAVLLLGAVASATAPAAERVHRGSSGRLDLLASAHPSAGRPVARDVAVDLVLPRRRSLKADTAATGSATCHGCEAEALALQVLYAAHGRRARLDNTATAWTQECRDCAATTVSVQVAVLRGIPALEPNNRALAVNAACETCAAASAAFQLVVVVDRGRRMPRISTRALRSWAGEQVARLREAPAPSESAAGERRRDPLQRQAVAALDELEALVATRPAVETVSAQVDLGR